MSSRRSPPPRSRSSARVRLPASLCKAEDIDDGQIMREVMNTVGKAGKLGEPVLVSVSMLTEGWMRPRVGTQLCDRSWRRRSVEPTDGSSPSTPTCTASRSSGRPSARTRTGSSSQRGGLSTPCGKEKKRQCRFPRLAGYRLEIRDPGVVRGVHGTVAADSGHGEHPDRGLGERPHRRAPRRTRSMTCGPSGTRMFALAHPTAVRPRPRPWYSRRCCGSPRGGWPSASSAGGTFPGLLGFAEYTDEAACPQHPARVDLEAGAQVRGGRPCFRQGECTRAFATDVDFLTTRDVFPTRAKCHVNFVVLDGIGGNPWESPWRRSWNGSRRSPPT